MQTLAGGACPAPTTRPRLQTSMSLGTAFLYSPPYGDGGMLCMIDPQFLAPDGASSLGAIAIGLLAETFFGLILSMLLDVV